MAQLRDHHQQLLDEGAGAAAIGLGAPEAAAGFKASAGVPFPLLVDPDRSTYKVMRFKRGSLRKVAGPKVVAAGIKSVLGGNRATRPKQDPLQLGGAAVIASNSVIVYEHHNETSDDNVSMQQLLEAVARAR